MRTTHIAASFVIAAGIAIGAYFYLGNKPETAPIAQAAPTPVEAPAQRVEPSDATLPIESTDPTLDLQISNRYDVVLATAKPLADSGDPEALDTIAKVYQYCQNYLVSPESYRQGQEALIKMRPADADQLRAVLARVESRCELVNEGQPIQAEDTAAALSKAAEAGSLPAMVRVATSNPFHVAPEERSSLALSAVQSGDPELLFEAGALLPGADPSVLAELGLGTEQIDTLAVQVAACRLGANCGRGSLVMDSMCISGASCSLGNFEDIVRASFLTSGNAAAFEKKVAAVQQAFAGSRR